MPTVSNIIGGNGIADVTITSDLICPWCWVGLKKLQQASSETGVAVNVSWKPFLLRPNTPTEGIPKGGTPSSRVGAHLKQAGEQVGIAFTGLTDRTPSTVLFHAVMKPLQGASDNADKDRITAFHEAVFEGYFTLGVYPDADGILAAAKKVPEVYDRVASLLLEDNQQHLLHHLCEKVVEEALEASRSGISGVPSFAFGNEASPAFSGAQSSTTFARYLLRHAKPHSS